MDLKNDTKDKKTNCDCKEDKVQQGEKGPPSERTKGLIPAVPPVLKNVGKLAAGVAGMASGSATEKKVNYCKYEMDKCKSANTTTGNLKEISTCIEYGITTNEHKNKLQNKEILVTHKPEDTEKEKYKNQNVVFQAPNNRCTNGWVNKSSTIYSNTQIKCNVCNVNKSYQCPNRVSNSFNRIRYEDLINKEDIVFSCDVSNNNNSSTNNEMSSAIKSLPVTYKNFDSFETPEMLNQSSNNFNENENTPNVYPETEDVTKLQINTFEIDSTKNIPLFSNNIDTLGALKTSTYENYNRNTSNEYLEAKQIVEFKLDKSEINTTYADLLDTSKTSTYGNTNKNTSSDNMEPKYLFTSQIDKPEMNSTKNAQLLSNNVDLFSATSTTYDNSNRNIPNDNLESKNLLISQMDKPKFNSTKDTTLSQMDKPKFNSTKDTTLFSNNLDLFAASNKVDEEKAHVNTTTSAPTFSNNVDLFEMKNEHYSSIKKLDDNVNKNKSAPQDTIDLFDRSNVAKNKIEVNKGMENKSPESGLKNTTKDAPVLISDVNLFSTIKKKTNNIDTVENNPDEKNVPMVDTSDLSNLPDIGEHIKYDPFFIERRFIGINNCKCKIFVKNNSNGSSLKEESCKIYTTTYGINTCRHVGNPRNKTALQPGHSLMDWIRLSHSGKDLTGVGPRAGTLSVSTKQLAEHNTENDAWIAIRGKVYNITAYFDFHPGGKEELMKGVGQDATQMFNAVHPWVNYESILQKCLVGRLTNAELNDEVISLFYGRSNQTIQVPKNFRFLTTNTVNSNGGLPNENISIPKFDWIQQLDYITTIFYTKPLSNPQVQVTAPTKENKLKIILSYCNHIFNNHIHFSNNIHWPCKVSLKWDTGKVEVNFRKITSKIWDNYGTLTQDSEIVTEDYEYEKIKYVVLNNVKENYNTHLIAFQRIDGVKQTIPIGFYVKVYGTIDDQELIRCYTPVPCSFMRKYSNDYEAYRGDVCLLVKLYPEGLLSPTICKSVKGDVFEFSPPLGDFNMDKIANRNAYLLLAAGSGITPMLAIIKFVLENTQQKCVKIHLLYFNRTEEDIILRKHFDSLQKSDDRIVVKHILSRPSLNWTGLTGYINLNLVKTSIDEQCTNSQLFPVDIFSLICGPLVFTNLAKSILTDIGYTDDNIHLFNA